MTFYEPDNWGIIKLHEKNAEVVRMNIAGVIRQMTDSGMASYEDFRDFKELYERK
jgi:hypothetical protein